MLLRLAYSPCPNDTYTYYGIMSGRVSLDHYPLEIHHHDIETLNKLALEGVYEITKISFFAWLKLKKKYRLCNAGNALGFGCGPVLIAKNKNIKTADLPDLRIALPGELTTANLLFSLFCPQAKNKLFSEYDQIFSEIKTERADCGVIIHESRFLFEKEGFHKVCDLGQWWESVTRLPLPLGAVGIRSDLPVELDPLIENLIRKSLAISQNNPQLPMPYIKKMAIEMDTQVINQHIHTFVNAFTFELGEKGRAAVSKLEALAISAGIIK